MNLDQISDADVASFLAAAAGVFVYLSRILIEKRAARRRSDSGDNSERMEFSRLDYLSELRKDNAKLRTDIEKMASERNAALSQLGAVQAELEHYKALCERKAFAMQSCPIVRGDDGRCR